MKPVLRSELGRSTFAWSEEQFSRYRKKGGDTAELDNSMYLAACGRLITDMLPTISTVADRIEARLARLPLPVRAPLVSVLIKLKCRRLIGDLNAMYRGYNPHHRPVAIGVSRVQREDAIEPRLGVTLYTPKAARAARRPHLPDSPTVDQKLWRRVVLLLVPSEHWQAVFGDLLEIRKEMRESGEGAVLIEAVTAMELLHWSWRRPWLFRFGGLAGLLTLGWLLSRIYG